MKLTTLLLPAFALSGLTSALTDQQICQKRNQNVPAAIEAFCNYSDIVVPSSYAFEGAYVGLGGPHSTTVHITGTCNPGQWVPHQYCLSQFYSMCAQGNGVGNMDVRLYGRNNCQHWHILVGEEGSKVGCKDC